MQTRIFGRTKAHRIAMLRNLSRSLVLAESVTTTEPRAKEVKRIVDRWIVRAKGAQAAQGSLRLAATRQLIALVHDPRVVSKLMSDLALRSKTRTSGFVSSRRILTRVGDAAPRLVLRLIDQAKSPKIVASTKPSPPKHTSQADV
ncbi:50S ribosomal protein L17 [Candidatus Berkelbacteria bacterium]|nr:50S ribosomal protein L17 [Candidatus Berkelbacteria bacterium]